jgi:hypothetical protein
MEFNGVCPWCGGDKLYWNSEKNCYICFSGECQRKGHGKPPVEVWLSAHDSLKYLPGGMLVLPDGARPLFLKARSHCDRRIQKYLLKHHIQPAQARKHGLMQTDNSLVIPFYNQESDLVYFQERGVFGAKSFKNAPVSKGDTMFFTDRGSPHVILVESAVSAIRLRPLFGPSAAFLGKPSHNQLERLRRSGSRGNLHAVTILMDSDAYGNSVEILMRLMGWIPNIRVCLLKWGDPCDVPDRLLKKVLKRNYA